MLNYNPFAFVMGVAIAVAVLLLCEPLMWALIYLAKALIVLVAVLMPTALTLEWWHNRRTKKEKQDAQAPTFTVR